MPLKDHTFMHLYYLSNFSVKHNSFDMAE